MKREFTHPNYDPFKSNNDFGIIILAEGVATSNTNARIVRINPTSSYPSVGAGVTVVGYGDTTQSDSTTVMPASLMKVNVNVISNSDCEDSSDGFDNYYNQITSNMICAAVNQGGKDACQVSGCYYLLLVLILLIHWNASMHVWSLTLGAVCAQMLISPPGRLRWASLCHQWQRACPSRGSLVGDWMCHGRIPGRLLAHFVGLPVDTGKGLRI